MNNQTKNTRDAIRAILANAADYDEPHPDKLGWEEVHIPTAIADLEALINQTKQETLDAIANNLIDQEKRLYETYSDDNKICVGIKIMADEVREYYEGGIYRDQAHSALNKLGDK